MINYSENGSVVDGVLFSCDISDKDLSPNEQPTTLTLDDIIGTGSGRRASRCRAKLEAARHALKDKQKAKIALEGALRLTIPISAQDDALLAEELSKSEGLMTRTGLKRVSIESTQNPSVVSIPLSKARKLELTENKKEINKKSASKYPSQPVLRDSTTNSGKSQSSICERTIHKDSTSSIPTVKCFPTRPCLCDSNDDAERRDERLEGTAVLTHGSRLRFGCLEFVLSMAGCPGHSELISVLLEQS